MHFAYDPARPILQGVSFEIPAGKTVAGGGAPGSGKPRYAAAVPLLRHQQGRITIAGQEIRSVTQASVRQAIGIVPQDTVLFNDTVAYNIAYGRTGATQQEVEGRPRRIASTTSSPPRLRATPPWWASGGSSLAVKAAWPLRTLLKNPPILIFDEATSALDSANERAIQAELQSARRTRPRCSLRTASPPWWTRTKFW